MRLYNKTSNKLLQSLVTFEIMTIRKPNISVSGFLPLGGGGGRGAPPEAVCPSLKFGPKTIA